MSTDQQPVASAERMLANFGAAVLAAHRDSARPFLLDYGDVQDMAFETGVIRGRPVSIPCGDNCACAECDGLPGYCLFIDSDVSQFIKDQS